METIVDSTRGIRMWAASDRRRIFALAWLGGGGALVAQTWLWGSLQGSHAGWWECVLVSLPDLAFLAAVIPLIDRLSHGVPLVAERWRHAALVHGPAALGVAVTASLVHVLVAAGLGWVAPGPDVRALLALRIPLHLPTWMVLYVTVALGTTPVFPGRDDTSGSDTGTANAGGSPPPPMQRLAVPVDEGTVLLEVDTIDWIEADRNYSILHAAKDRHRVRESLGSLAERLPPQFVRIHRSRMVNLERVTGVYRWRHGDFVVRLLDGTRLRLSRTYRQALEERLGTRV